LYILLFGAKSIFALHRERAIVQVQMWYQWKARMPFPISE